jgi:hypothetical protein
MKKIIKESGIRDINKLSQRYPKAEIYFHQDLDGVTTAIAMKKYLEDNGINVVDAHVIQYGDKEFSVKKNDAQGDTMPVLVDFAHGKPMFVIHTDHHDRQAGAEDTKSTSFRQSRSNVETISQIVSPKELFPSSDILLISTVDSADFAKHNISPDEVVNYLFRFDKEKPLQRNKMLLGFVVNKLILAFKNKPGFLEGLVMNSEPSLMSILTNIKEWMKKTNAVNPEILQKNAEDYKTSMQGYPNVGDNIIFQYGGVACSSLGLMIDTPHLEIILRQTFLLWRGHWVLFKHLVTHSRKNENLKGLTWVKLPKKFYRNGKTN